MIAFNLKKSLLAAGLNQTNQVSFVTSMPAWLRSVGFLCLPMSEGQAIPDCVALIVMGPAAGPVRTVPVLPEVAKTITGYNVLKNLAIVPQGKATLASVSVAPPTEVVPLPKV